MLSEDEEPILPEAFIPVIEADEELTKKFGSWFLEHAFIDGARLMRDLEMNLTISINILAFQANRPEFIERLTALIEKTGIYNNNLQFELSEAQPLNATGIYNLQKLHDELGIRLVLGNFGTGYSNIDLLRKLPFDMIELSKEFTKGITEYELELKVIVGILQMAQVLDIDVCAKGIETAEQMELLEEAGFKMGQGFLIGKPLPMAELKSFICKYADEGNCGK
jgi:EAL domain-containing protein (putative c-di-GMP-specific phosphodiesterase class I)